MFLEEEEEEEEELVLCQFFFTSTTLAKLFTVGKGGRLCVPVAAGRVREYGQSGLRMPVGVPECLARCPYICTPFTKLVLG